MRPSPSTNFGHVDTVFVRVVATFDLFVAELLPGVTSDCLQPRDAINSVDRQGEAINFIVNGQFHRGVDVPVFLVATHVQVPVGAGVGQAVNEVGIAMEVEDDRLVGREERIEVPVR